MRIFNYSVYFNPINIYVLNLEDNAVSEKKHKFDQRLYALKVISETLCLKQKQKMTKFPVEYSSRDRVTTKRIKTHYSVTFFEIKMNSNV